MPAPPAPKSAKPAPSPLGARLREARERAELGVRELAGRTGTTPTPVTASAISMLENGGQESIDGRQLVALAMALGVTAEWLVTGKQPAK